MTKKYLVIGMAAMLGASLSFFACESATGGAGAAGAPGVIYLAGEYSSEAIQHAIDSGASLVFAGVIQGDAGTITIPAGRGVTLVGGTAYSVKNDVTGTLIVSDGAGISSASTGKIANGSGTLTLVAPQSVIDSKTASDVTSPLTIYNSVEEVGTPGTSVALAGPVTIGGTETSGKNITVSGLTDVSGTLYVVGGLTVSANLTTTSLYVTGKATFGTAAQTALAGLTAGSVESSVAITGASNASIAVGGELKTTGETSHVTLAGTGTLTAGSLDLSGNLTAGTATTGAVTVNGPATIAGTVTNGSAAAVFTFNGTTAIDTFTSGNAGTIIAGSGAVTIAKALGPTATNTVIVKSTGGVTLTAANTIAANLVATKATVYGGTTGVTIGSSAGSIALAAANGNIDVTASGASIVAGGTSGTVTITGAGLSGGAFTAANAATATLTLAANAIIEATGTGAVTIGTAGQIVLTNNTSKINLVNGGSLVASAAGDLIKTSATATGVTLTVSATGNATPTHATVGTETPFTVTTASAAGSGSQKVIVGKVSWTIDKTAAVNAQVGAAATDSAAAGTLKAGAGTTLVIAATS